MKRFALVLCCFAFALVTLQARADMDPTIGMGDPNCSSFAGGTINTSGNFAIQTNGGGTFAFCNTSGTLWSTFDVVVPYSESITASTVFCNVTGNPAPFGGCSVTNIGGIEGPPTYVDIYFSSNGTNCSGNTCGIPNDFYMLVSLNDPGSTTGSWPTGTTLYFEANGSPGSATSLVGTNVQTISNVPEPASALLFGSGLGGLWALRRRRRA